MKKVLTNKKKCPYCKFDGCWLKASICEECGYDFINQKNPKKKKIELDDDDVSDVVVKEVAPKNTVKMCPECGHKCFWRSPLCESCQYDFVEQKKKKVDEEPKVEFGIKEYQKSVGYRINWNLVPVESWMEEFGDNLTKWAQSFLRRAELKLGFGRMIYPGVVADYARISKNPEIRKNVEKLEDLYYHRSGIVRWKEVDGGKFWEGWSLTESEVKECYQDDHELSREMITVERMMGNSVYWDRIFSREVAGNLSGRHFETHMPDGKFRHWHLLPDEWANWNAQERVGYLRREYNYWYWYLPDTSLLEKIR